MSIKYSDKEIFLTDHIPHNIVLLRKTDMLFIKVGDMGFVYDKETEETWQTRSTNGKEESVTLLQEHFEWLPENKNKPLLEVTVYTTKLKQAHITVHETNNDVSRGKYALVVELKEGYTYEDIPWLPKESKGIVYSEFKALETLYAELEHVILQKEELEIQREQEDKETLELKDEYYETQESEEASTQDQVYTVMTEGGQTLIATTNRSKAFLQGDQLLGEHTKLYIKTWKDGKFIKIVTLTEE